MVKVYKHYTKEEITKEILDTIKVGNLIKVNEWKKPMRVVGVSENYFVMTSQQFGDIRYSVFSKMPFNQHNHNNLIRGYYYCGVDSWIFGFEDFEYDFKNKKSTEKYLQSFEDGKSEISHRNSISIHDLYVK